jgi:hypothetical protein
MALNSIITERLVTKLEDDGGLNEELAFIILDDTKGIIARAMVHAGREAAGLTYF